MRERYGRLCREFGDSWVAERLRGGSKKGVYRLTFDDGRTAVVYDWDESENYWPTPQESTGLALFLNNHALLGALGVRVPRIYATGADLALVEDVRGGTLEARLETDGAATTLTRLRAALEKMRAYGGQRHGRPCEDVVLEHARADLAHAAENEERIGRAYDVLERRLAALRESVEPRERYALIHGELGPDHVLVDDDGDPVLIDIEAARVFDVEWEHVFLELRFGDHYPALRIDGLDGRRMEFYRLAMHLSLVAGPLRLLEGAFPERELMVDIVRHNTECALRLTGALARDAVPS
ncbi:phosphotransferase [Nonomuraea sp. NPDC059194]|uniref:phosphotransferase n=1 Tax=Nonomuraea sp. NPDC059194 TaxID=3346764 RepID=UPI0036ACD334